VPSHFNWTLQYSRTRRINEILTAVDHDIEFVRNCKYLGAAIDNTNDETQEIRARILVANKACSCLQIMFISKQIHRNNKIKLYKTLIKPELC
jgi:hypothetical protein